MTIECTRKRRMKLMFFAATVTMASATIQPSVAQDQSADPPISITSCRVEPTYDPILSSADGVSTSPTAAIVWITFLNRSPRTVTDVTFLLDTTQALVTIRDKGRFSSGVPIQHVLGPFAYIDDDARCEPYSVRFEDGTAWQRSYTFRGGG